MILKLNHRGHQDFDHGSGGLQGVHGVRIRKLARQGIQIIRAIRQDRVQPLKVARVEV